MIGPLKRLDTFMTGRTRPVRWLISTVGALLLVAIAGGIRGLFTVAILPYLLFLPAIMAASLLFGVLGGTVAVIAAAMTAVYFFLPPDDGFVIADFGQGLSVSLFVLVTLGMSAVCAALRTSLLRIERSKDELEERVSIEVEKRGKIEDTLRQSQKMEAVGQLTGGLAHDFNNLLTGITGSLDLLESKLSRGTTEGLGRYIETAQASAARAASLTHRLLAFSRRQTLEPKIIDIGVLVSGMSDLLRRTLGPSINLDVICDQFLWYTLVDPSQLENAVLNLCLNARDAMPNGGTIYITATNRILNEELGAERCLPPGDYLSLRVIDTGAGMSPATIERAFEPFFTTKPLGMGTGLGLSMVFGFARQSGGSVKIHSTVNGGTRICLLLPRHFGNATPERPYENAREANVVAGETVLIVDDEPAIVMLAEETLRELGYRTLTASTGATGLEILRSDAKIDMLVTDVGLPGGMNGRQMADAGRLARPRLPVLFITGFAEASVLSGGMLETGMSIMTKPFALDDFAARVQAAMT